jgi:hypothetical protein
MSRPPEETLNDEAHSDIVTRVALQNDERMES